MKAEAPVGESPTVEAPPHEAAADRGAPAPPEVEAPRREAPAPPEVEAPADRGAPPPPDVEAPAERDTPDFELVDLGLREYPVEDETALPPSRRFARPEPWPAADSMWTCEIAWKPGYVKSVFRAMAAPPRAKRRQSIGESPPLRWTLMMDPEPPTPEMVETVRELADALEAAGWERTDAVGPWYALRFVWQREGQPQRVEVPGRRALKGTEDKDE